MLQRKKSMLKIGFYLFVVASCGAGKVLAADAKAGADTFDASCAECHSVAKPLKNKKGPGLLDVVGRQSASVTGFDYSDAMKAANLTWTRENLDAYITNPKQLVPNDKMKFKGLANGDERANLIDFLATLQ